MNMSNAKEIIIAGDVTMDWNLARAPVQERSSFLAIG